MRIVGTKITRGELAQMSAGMFGYLVKAVVDVERELMAVDADLHSDLEALLLKDGSEQKNLWGINLYPAVQSDGFIEFDSVINLRPVQGNMSRGVESAAIREQIAAVVQKRVES